MEPEKMARRILHSALLLLLSLSVSIQAQASPSKASKSGALTQSFVWYDGNQRRTVWLDPSLVVEFSTADVSQSSLKKEYPNSQLHSAVGRMVRIWNMGPGLDTEAATQKLRAQKSPERYSPIFHEGSQVSSRKRALPGNVVVYLKPEWSSSEVDQWVAKGGYTVVKKLSFGKNILLIKTSEGLESLTTANQIYQSGQVVAATPEWWEEIQVK